MEKISKEELMKKLNLSEEELEKVAGGGLSCMEACEEAEHEMVMYCNHHYCNLYSRRYYGLSDSQGT